jgi:hypothetical protein
MSRQRKLYRENRLSKARLELLESIKFPWRFDRSALAIQKIAMMLLIGLRIYHYTTGNVLNEGMKQNKPMKRKQVRKIGVPWPSDLQYAGEEPDNKKNRAFNSNAELLEAYFHKHGHIMLHHEKDKVLYKTQNRLKCTEARRSDAQKGRLRTIGFYRPSDLQSVQQMGLPGGE